MTPISSASAPDSRSSQPARGAAPAPSGPGAAPRRRLGPSGRARRVWKRLLFSAGALAASVWGWGWLSVDETGQPIAQPLDEPQAEIQGLKSLTVRRDGQPWWQISANRVSVAADGNTTLATGVGRGLLFRDGKPFLHLAAPTLRFSNLSNDLEASGGVRASGPNGFSFQTSNALWRSGPQEVECPKPVTAWLREVYFQTPRLSYNWTRGTLNCPQRVEVRARGAVLRGKNLEATLATHQVHLTGDVELIFAPSAVKAATASHK